MKKCFFDIIMQSGKHVYHLQPNSVLPVEKGLKHRMIRKLNEQPLLNTKGRSKYSYIEWLFYNSI